MGELTADSGKYWAESRLCDERLPLGGSSAQEEGTLRSGDATGGGERGEAKGSCRSGARSGDTAWARRGLRVGIAGGGGLDGTRGLEGWEVEGCTTTGV